MSDNVVTRETVRGLGRIYSNSLTGEAYSSVTTIIGVLDSPALPRWAARTVAEYVLDGGLASVAEMDREHAAKHLAAVPWKISKRAASIGSLVHAEAESILLERRHFNQPMSAGSDKREDIAHAVSNVRGLLEWLRSEFEVEVIALEGIVWEPKHGYAGAFDAILKVGDEVWICDWKTSGGVYAETSLQLAAYRHATFTINTATGETTLMPKIDKSFVFHVPKTGGWSIHETRSGEEEFTTFLACAVINAWNRSGRKIEKYAEVTS